jgi:putative ABC transport system permease protein
MKQETSSPRWVDSLIDNLAPDDLAEEIRGDLYEMFEKDISENGLRTARRNYVRNGIGFLLKSFFWKRTPSNANSSIMLISYFTMARRSLAAYKGTAAINILGLVIAIASAMVILTVIRFELSFDKFHTNSENIYRLVRVSGDDMSEYRTGISYPVPVALESEIPALKDNIVSMEYIGGVNVDILDAKGTSISKYREEEGCTLLEPAFFKMFDFKGTSFKWIAGNPETALKEPFSVVITKTLAKKYFGDRDALGQTLLFQRKYNCKITGVLEDFPPNTDFPFTIMVSYSTLEKLAGDETKNWTSVNDTHCTYIAMSPSTTIKEMEALIAKVHANHTSKELHEHRHYLLQKLHEVHYDAKFGTFSGRTISKPTLIGLGVVGLFLLLTGSINYINLATAQSTLRSKEIGLRKVMGSNRLNLMGQFITETFVIVFIAGIMALAVSSVLLLNMQELLNITIVGSLFADPYLWLSLLAIIVGVTLFAGVYPSLMISNFNPVTALKNRFGINNIGGISLRKVLVVVQFTITQMLVVGTFIVVSQMRYFQTKEMGFSTEAIVNIRLPDSKLSTLEALREKLKGQSFVSDVSFSYTYPSGTDRSRSYMDIGMPDASAMKDHQIFEYSPIDPDYLDLYGIKMIAGRNLKMSDSIGNILINKSLVKRLMLESPEKAVGQELKIGGDKVTVVGVVDDFYSNSLKESVDNIVMLVKPENLSRLSVKLNTTSTADMPAAVKEIEKIWSSFFPEHIFIYQFFDENVNAFYAQEEKYAKLFQMFSLVFLVIGCLGLYGLITFVVNRRGKEVAIRKVLGASLSSILVLFSREYVQLILLSFLLAIPATYFVVKDWLSNFANHIELKWWYFATPGLMVLIIALVVVASKSLRAANANPVDKLKYE